jgi:hypothetical protein
MLSRAAAAALGLLAVPSASPAPSASPSPSATPAPSATPSPSPAAQGATLMSVISSDPTLAGLLVSRCHMFDPRLC